MSRALRAGLVSRRGCCYASPPIRLPCPPFIATEEEIVNMIESLRNLLRRIA